MATLEGKTILIFGGSSGIGYAVAEACLASRASYVIIASSNPERVETATKKLRLEATKLGGKVHGEAVDAKDISALKYFVKRVGEVDHIVWTSGDFMKAGFPDGDVEFLKGVFDVRFWGPVVAAQNAKIRPGGSLTLTTGSIVLKPLKTMAIGAGVAGAVESLTRGLAVDLAPIRVNIISPGAVRTEFWENIPEGQRTAMISQFADRLLVKHIAEPHEVAEAYLFVMKCTFITGQRIDVDGGYVLGA